MPRIGACQTEGPSSVVRAPQVECAISKGKHISLMHDPVKGGGTLEALKEDECPEHLRDPVFIYPGKRFKSREGKERPVITWCATHSNFTLVLTLTLPWRPSPNPNPNTNPNPNPNPNQVLLP